MWSTKVADDVVTLVGLEITVLYVRRETVDVSTWLGIRPIDYPNYNIPFRFIDNFNKKQIQIYGK